jgi:RNA polymerase-associated protein CTR9
MTSADLLPWNSAPGRSIDIELGGQEVINIELDTLDSNADDVLEVLKEGQPRVAYWTRLAGEYMRRGHLDAAEKIALSATESTLELCVTYWLTKTRDRLPIQRFRLFITVHLFLTF